ncbi:MAG: hypothetical protein ACHQFZ_04365 [Acidimicrobiales bacterium]
MATAKAPTAPEVTEFAQQFRDEFVSALKQYQQFSLNATQNWVKAVSALPVAKLPTAVDGKDATTYVFDVATDLINAQREFALQLADVLVTK